MSCLLEGLRRASVQSAFEISLNLQRLDPVQHLSPQRALGLQVSVLEFQHIALISSGFNFSQHLTHKKVFSLCTDFFLPLKLWAKTKEIFSSRNAQEVFCMLIYSRISLRYLLSCSCSGREESVPCGFPVNVIKTQPWLSSTWFWQDAKPHSINVNMHLHSV